LGVETLITTDSRGLLVVDVVRSHAIFTGDNTPGGF